MISSPPSGASRNKRGQYVEIPTGQTTAVVDVDGGRVTLSNLQKVFWPEGAITKRDLLQYYAGISPFLLPHLLNRAMVMKRYPDGAYGKFFFQKRAPNPRPQWIPTCAIQHPSANVVDFPVIQNLAGLLWVIFLFSLAFFGQQSWSTLVMTLPTDMFPRHTLGTIAGLIGLGGALGGVVLGQLAGYLLDNGFSYVPVLVIAGSLHVVAFFLILAMVRSIKPLHENY